MGILGSILGRIFGSNDNDGDRARDRSPQGAQRPGQVQRPAQPAQQAPRPAPQMHAPGQPANTGPSDAVRAQTGQIPAPQPVDVEKVLEEMAARKGGGGNWRTSIVDLLKLLDLDSSLDARKELAEELNVHAGAHGSAEQNIALSKAVWAELARNGGRVSDNLRAA